jgi:ATP-binding cassette, subfamily B, multidrug efflux pump
MLRLIKYTKPYIWLILAAIVLLFIMANADLALPDYLSQIVNVGIQNNGIDDVLPQAIRQKQLDRMRLFFSAEEQELVNQAYRLIEETDDEALLAQFPALANEPIYLLEELSDPAFADLRAGHGQGLDHALHP